MVDLRNLCRRRACFARELPDYLPVVLEVRLDADAVRTCLARRNGHLLNAIFAALHNKSPYASVVGALLELAGEQARAVGVEPGRAHRRKLGRAARLRRMLIAGQAAGATHPFHFVRKIVRPPRSCRRCNGVPP